MQEIAIVLGQSHPPTVSQITLSPLITTTAQHCLIRAAARRLQITAIVHLCHSGRAASLRAVGALLLVLEEVVGAFLTIGWVQRLVEECLLPSLIAAHALGLLLSTHFHGGRSHDGPELAVLISPVPSLIALTLRIRLLIAFRVDDLGPCRGVC